MTPSRKVGDKIASLSSTIAASPVELKKQFYTGRAGKYAIVLSLLLSSGPSPFAAGQERDQKLSGCRSVEHSSQRSAIE